MTSFPVMVEATSPAGDVAILLVAINAYGVAIDAAAHNDVATKRVVINVGGICARYHAAGNVRNASPNVRENENPPTRSFL